MSKPRTSPWDESPLCFFTRSSGEKGRNEYIYVYQETGIKAPAAVKQAATGQPVRDRSLGWLSRTVMLGGDACSHLLPFICTDFHRPSTVSIPISFLGKPRPCLVPGGDEHKRLFQGSALPRIRPHVRKQQATHLYDSLAHRSGSSCPVTWRRLLGDRGTARQAVLPPDPSHRTNRERLAKGWTQPLGPGLDCKPKLGENSQSYETSCFCIVTP